MNRIMALKRGEMLCVQNEKVVSSFPFWDDGYVLYGLTTFAGEPREATRPNEDAFEAANSALYDFKGNCVIVRLYDGYKVSAYQHFNSAKEAFEYAIERYEKARTLSEHFVIKNCKTKEIIYQQ